MLHPRCNRLAVAFGTNGAHQSAMAGSCRRIVLIQGHPDRDGHYCHALAERYASGARGAGHRVEVINLSDMALPFLRSAHDLRHGRPPEGVRLAQASLLACDHIVLMHPLWNGGAPAMVRAFMEQAFRPAFAFPDADENARPSFVSALRARKALSGKTARVVTTMQMPALIYRLLFRPHQEANALWLAGARPVRQTPIGMVEAKNNAARERWLCRMTHWGEQAS
jgi:putative NADPH-quinone reductase